MVSNMSSPAAIQRHLFDPAEVAALPHATSIDRSKTTRTVPLKLICVGPPRSGTVSLRQALIELGYHDVYHYTTTIQENPSDAKLWLRALQGKFTPSPETPPFTKKDWDGLLGHCQATTDSPTMVFWKELIQMYPEAKVILTVRDSPEQWVSSQMQTIQPFMEKFIMPVRCDAEGVDDGTRMAKMLVEHAPLYQALWADYQEGCFTGKRAKEWYEGHVKEVQEAVPGALVFNVKEGWGKLCEFLAVEDVPDRPFPRRNDAETFQKNVADLEKVMMVGRN